MRDLWRKVLFGWAAIDAGLASAQIAKGNEVGAAVLAAAAVVFALMYIRLLLWTLLQERAA